MEQSQNDPETRQQKYVWVLSPVSKVDLGLGCSLGHVLATLPLKGRSLSGRGEDGPCQGLHQTLRGPPERSCPQLGPELLGTEVSL